MTEPKQNQEETRDSVSIPLVLIDREPNGEAFAKKPCSASQLSFDEQSIEMVAPFTEISLQSTGNNQPPQPKSEDILPSSAKTEANEFALLPGPSVN